MGLLGWIRSFCQPKQDEESGLQIENQTLKHELEELQKQKTLEKLANERYNMLLTEHNERAASFSANFEMIGKDGQFEIPVIGAINSGNFQISLALLLELKNVIEMQTRASVAYEFYAHLKREQLKSICFGVNLPDLPGDRIIAAHSKFENALLEAKLAASKLRLKLELLGPLIDACSDQTIDDSILLAFFKVFELVPPSELKVTSNTTGSTKSVSFRTALDEDETPDSDDQSEQMTQGAVIGSPSPRPSA